MRKKLDDKINIRAIWPLEAETPAIFALSSLDRLNRLLTLAGFDKTQAEKKQSRFDLVIRLDYIFELPILKALLSLNRECALTDDKGRVVAILFAHHHHDRTKIMTFTDHAEIAAGFDKVTVQDICSDYNSTLRKRQIPYLYEVTKATQRKVEWKIYMSSYKGATDFVTKYFWPLPAFWVTRFCASLGVTPNQVTLISLILVFATMGAFIEGWFGLGIVLAWLMTFLDTIDGKLARVTLRSSAWGNVFDHGIDLIHPPFWYYAWYLGIEGAARGPLYLWALWIILGGYVLGRLQEGLFIALFKIEIHTWQKIDYLFRLITARRNPNLFILMVFTILAAPAEGFLVVALWTILSLLFHFYRIFIALIGNSRGKRPVSWLQNV